MSFSPSPVRGRQSPDRDSTLGSRAKPTPSGSLISRVQAEHERELSRMHSLWQDAKSELSRKADELLESEERRRADLDKQRRQYEKQLDEQAGVVTALKDKQRFVDRQLEKLRMQHSALQKEFLEQKTELARRDSALKQHEFEASRQERSINELGAKLGRLNETRDKEKETTILEIEEHQSQLMQARIALKELKAENRDLTDEVKRLNEVSVVHKSKIGILEAEVEETEAQRNVAMRDARVAMEETERMRSILEAEGDLRAEIHRMKEDNTRLFTLVKGTGLYKSLVDDLKVADTTDHLDLRYLPTDGKSLYNEEIISEAKSKKYRAKRSGSPRIFNRDYEAETHGRGEGNRELFPSRERYYWIPTEAVKVAGEFRGKNFPNVPWEIFTELLVRLNGIWLTREKTRVKRVKDTWKRKVSESKRKAVNGIPTENIVARTEIERLKKDLKEARTVRDRRLVESEEQILDSSLRAVDKLGKQVSQLTTENRELHARVKELARLRRAMAQTDEFGEGMKWSSRNAIRAVHTLHDQIVANCTKLRRDTRELNPMDNDIYSKFTSLVYSFVDKINRDVSVCEDALAQRVEADNPAWSRVTVEDSRSSPGDKWAYSRGAGGDGAVGLGKSSHLDQGASSDDDDDESGDDDHDFERSARAKYLIL